MRATAAALALTALAACSNGSAKGDDPLPMIAIDACPAPQDLLTTPPTQGKRLPDVKLRCLGHDGEVSMRLLGATPTVVNLWGSWCFPCRTEMPEFQKVHKALEGKVRFLGVDTKDYERPARNAIQNAGISYANVFDPDEHIKRSVNARSLPTTILVGADGLIKNVHVGQLTGEELRGLITKYLNV